MPRPLAAGAPRCAEVRVRPPRPLVVSFPERGCLRPFEPVTDAGLEMFMGLAIAHGPLVKVFSITGGSMRERELGNWAHLKSGDCRQRFLTPSKAQAFFFPSSLYDTGCASV